MIIVIIMLPPDFPSSAKQSVWDKPLTEPAVNAEKALLLSSYSDGLTATTWQGYT